MGDEVLRVIGPERAAHLGPVVYTVIDASYRGAPHEGPPPSTAFLRDWERQVVRVGFRLVLLEDTEGRPLGFLYGYSGRAGTWWFDSVAGALDPVARARWLTDAFEIVSMAVLPAERGVGRGTRLLRTCLHTAPGRTAVLSTHRDGNPALELYRREGFVIVHPGLRFSDPGAPFVVMARDLGSARPGTVGSAGDR